MRDLLHLRIAEGRQTFLDRFTEQNFHNVLKGSWEKALRRGLTCTSTVTGTCLPGELSCPSCWTARATPKGLSPASSSCLLVGFAASISHSWRRARARAGPAGAAFPTPGPQQRLDSDTLMYPPAFVVWIDERWNFCSECKVIGRTHHPHFCSWSWSGALLSASLCVYISTLPARFRVLTRPFPTFPGCLHFLWFRFYAILPPLARIAVQQMTQQERLSLHTARCKWERHRALLPRSAM